MFGIDLNTCVHCGGAIRIVASIEEPTAIRAILSHFENHGALEQAHYRPGNARNTVDLTRHIAREARSYVLSVSGLMRREDIPAHLPHADLLREALPDVCADGGSCIAAPTGDWIVAPCIGEERLLIAALDPAVVRAERQNFDPFGHYSRPDVLELQVNRSRPAGAQFSDVPLAELGAGLDRGLVD